MLSSLENRAASAFKIMKAILYTVVIFVAGLSVVFTLMLAMDFFRVSQPREGLEKFAPEYMSVFADIQQSCGGTNKCSKEQLDAFLQARDVALEQEWPQVVEKLSQRWRWGIRMVGGSSNPTVVEQDFFRLMSEAGGREGLQRCFPLVRWKKLGLYFHHDFIGVSCSGKELSMTY